jgi:GNAT superfamily N-acetyltransferase
MSEASRYSTFETLRDGRPIEIRALRPEDRHDLIGALERTSAQSLYRRFFGVKRGFTEKEAAFFVNIDFVSHIALVAVVEEDGKPRIVGGGRYFVLKSGQAEVAFIVIDQYQGQGIGAALMRHLSAIARRFGVRQMIADVLPDNIPMLKMFERSGFPLSRKQESGVVHVTIQLF